MGVSTYFAIIKYMNDLVKRLKGYDYVIVDYATKLELLKLRIRNPLLTFKIFTVEELITKFLGSASDQSLFALLEKYNNLTYEHAKIINNTIVFPNVSKSSLKVNTLSTYQKALKALNLLESDFLIAHSLHNKKILLPKYLASNYLLINLLNSVHANFEFTEDMHNFIHEITVFHTGVDEVYAALNRIAALLANGVKPSLIKILKPNSAYEELLRKLAPQFNIVLGPRLFPLNAFSDVVAFVEQFKGQRIDISDPLIQTLRMSTSAPLIALYNLIIAIDFNSVSNKHHYAILKDKIKSESIALEDNDGIEFINEIPLFSANDTYYFYLNFANGAAPNIQSLNPYLNNEERKQLGLLDDETIALINENKLISTLNNNKNIYISFAKIFGQENYELSTLADKLEYECIEHQLAHKIYSQKYFNYLTGVSYDKLIFYKKHDENFDELFIANDYFDDYGSFDYKFKGINHYHEMVYLSPTKIDLYQRLPFDYFVQHLLNIVDDRPSIHLHFGEFVHSVLENSTSEETFKVCFSHYLDQMNFNTKDRFFVENERDLIAEAFRFNQRYLNTVMPTKIHNETLINAPFAAKCVLNGRLDRILLFEKDEKKYIFVVDFKTGNATTNPKNYEYGLDLQLPLYGLLLSLTEDYKDYEVSALVLNSIKLTSTYSAGSRETFTEAIINDIKYTGILIDDADSLKILNAEADSERPFFKIGGRGKVKKLTDLIRREEYKNYMEVTRNKVEETYVGILNNDFRIEDKKINNESSAKYSRYKEISFLPRNSVIEEADYEEGNE